MNNKTKYALVSFFVTMILTTGAYAKDKQESLQVGTRAMTLQEHVEHQEVRAKKIDNEKEAVKPLSKGFTTTHEGVYHHPFWVSPLGDKVELEDGTLWSVAYSDRKKTFDWYTNDTIVITPNHSWFSSYHYRIRNQTSGQNVKVNIMDVPLDTVLSTHWIVQIDPANKEICLDDGSVWEVAGWEQSVIKKWFVGDRVVIGSNDGWFSGSNPNILINIETLSYAASSCVY